jgi:hypothetical protein
LAARRREGVGGEEGKRQGGARWAIVAQYYLASRGVRVTLLDGLAAREALLRLTRMPLEARLRFTGHVHAVACVSAFMRVQVCASVQFCAHLNPSRPTRSGRVGQQ